MKETSALTAKVLAYKEVPDFDMNEVIDWALDMLNLGYDTPNLLITSSLSEIDNYFEKAHYFEKACQELGFAPLVGETGIISYSSFFIKKIALDEQVRTNLAEVYAFCQTKDYADSIYDFYLLYWAWDDFDYGDRYSNYWLAATPETVEHLVVEVAKNWLAKNIAVVDNIVP